MRHNRELGFLPLIPIALIAGGAATGAIIMDWINDPNDVWADKDVFNSRMQEMQSLGMSLNNLFSMCPEIMNNPSQLASWRGTRNGFSKFYGQVGTLKYRSPSDEHIAEAKRYGSKFAFWDKFYRGTSCGKTSPNTPTFDPDIIDPPKDDPDAPDAPTKGQDWAGIIKWSAIGVGGLFAMKTLGELFGKRK